MGYASLLRDGVGKTKKGKPASTVYFDIAKTSDSDLLAMNWLYDDGADRDIILRKRRALSSGVAHVFPHSVD
uniref:Uncharacterized protein n=1 Tax=Peronospora matthiolae TaxID=2874970 RepID=A0AAV1UKX3_9STRA